MKAVIAIDYATGVRRQSWVGRHRRRLAIAFAFMLLFSAAIYFREPIRRYVVWHYEFWRLSRMTESDLTLSATGAASKPRIAQLGPPGLGANTLPSFGDLSAIQSLRALDWRIDEMCRGGLDGGTTRPIALLQLHRPDREARTLLVYGPPSIWLVHWASELGFAVLARPSVLESPPGSRSNMGWGYSANGPPVYGIPHITPISADATSFELTFTRMDGSQLESIWTSGRVENPLPLIGRLQNDDTIEFTDQSGVVLSTYDHKRLSFGRNFASVERRAKILAGNGLAPSSP